MDRVRSGVVYGVYDNAEPDKIRYVGRTVQELKQRMWRHVGDARSGRFDYPLHRWMRKRGCDLGRIKVRILSHHASVSELNEAETSTIRRLRESGQADLTLAAGGEGGLGGWWSEDRKRKHLESVPRGDRHPFSKLTQETVSRIRRERQSQWRSSQEIADEFGMSEAAVVEMSRNDTRSAPGYDPLKLAPITRSGEGAYHRKLTWGDVQELRRRATQELKSQRKWAAELGLSQTNVRDILSNKIWYDPEFNPETVKRNPQNKDRKKIS